jgi:hypothetical protein
MSSFTGAGWVTTVGNDSSGTGAEDGRGCRWFGNAVLAALGRHPQIPQFEMYTEVLQDSVVDLICSDLSSLPVASAVAMGAAAWKKTSSASIPNSLKKPLSTPMKSGADEVSLSAPTLTFC